ncbi:MAG: glucosamine-6-phosphate deaminase [Christensenellaceae bacterium]|jgi:glucosamine-6-phosphate deaminase|nr:glucosamine-6-phosphate deaminase [Christensenellaceae bacterium]
MRVKVVNNYEILSKEAESVFLEAIKLKEKPIFGLATGSTPIGLYKNLVNSFNEGKISFKDAKTFNLDEYIGLSKEDTRNYKSFMNENLFSKVDIDLKNTFFPDVYNKDLKQSCLSYSKLLSNYKRDIQILGLGENGHIAFNEPGTEFNSKTHIVKLTESTIKANSRFFKSLEETPSSAITMGIEEILNAHLILLLVAGEKKKEALKILLDGKITIECPASALLNNPNLIIICDKEAYPYKE